VRDAFSSQVDRVNLFEFCLAGEGFFRGAIKLGLKDMIARIDEDIETNIPRDWQRLMRFYCKKASRIRRIWLKLKSRTEKIALRSISQINIDDCIQQLRRLESNPHMPDSVRLANE
jgi:hypothetical protein